MQLEAHEVVAVIESFAARLETDRTELDALNVFPVADNDTGSNMGRTLGSITAALTCDDPPSMRDVAASVEMAALDGRGNSGLIIGQFLAGFCAPFDGGHLDLDHGVVEGAARARAAVAAPVEGTMLTVADAAARALRTTPNLDLGDLIDVVAAAVQATPTQLQVLADRGVVDSGAAGLQLFFEALQAVLDGPPGGGAAPDTIACNVGFDPAANRSAEATAHEIQFRVPSQLVDAAELRTLLAALGTDVVVASAAEELAAHLHAQDPHVTVAAISAALETRPGAKAISYDVEPIVETERPA